MDCTWTDPGSDPYTGSARAAIMAFAQIPQAVRTALIERAESNGLTYDEVVVIDRDAIRGSARYAPELRSMHFGSRGRICDTVSRTGWSAEHVETAMVFCEAGYCVARPAVCNNWSMVTRLEMRLAPTQSNFALAWSPPAWPDAPPDVAEPVLSAPVDEQSFAHASSERWLPFGTPGFDAPHGALSPDGATVAVPAAAVPEPPAPVLIALGLAVIVAWRRR